MLPLLSQYLPLCREHVALLGADNDGGRKLAQRYGLNFSTCTLTPENYAAKLARHLSGGDVLLNLSLGVGSLDLMAWCREQDVVYIDSNLEPWTGQTHSLALARMHALRWQGHGRATAVFWHGANPGLVTHFLKEVLALLAPGTATCYEAVQALGIQVLVISEFDSRRASMSSAESNHGKTGIQPEFEFSNTLSASGLAGELCASAELAWGTHEGFAPVRAVLRSIGRGLALQLPTSGRATLVRSWTPSAGEFHGYLLGHLESFSMAELLSAPVPNNPIRPTVFYAVKPCFAAEAATRNMTVDVPPSHWRYRVLKDELFDGGIELGVLLLGPHLSYWYGSHLTLSEARRLRRLSTYLSCHLMRTALVLPVACAPD
ncbi:homospermidine synthase [Paraburkholderia sp. MM5384-R2]|nr:homospermidine synthase [Paraburkholderia sp. MM5384-R2]